MYYTHLFEKAREIAKDKNITLRDAINIARSEWLRYSEG